MTGTGPERGPGGWLPERAAKRARKIVLRERMALSWPAAALVAAVVVAATGAVFLLSPGGPPAPPFVAVADVAGVAGADGLPVTAQGRTVLLLRAAGTLRAYLVEDPTIAYCPDSDRLEAPDGRVWTLQGRLLGGEGDSLVVLPTALHEGTVYVDPIGGSSLEPRRQGAHPACGTAVD